MTGGRRRVLEEVAARLPPAVRPTLVAVDGVDGAGKTTFADELAEVLREAGRLVVRASVDDFHQPRTVRRRRGSTGESFWADSFDYPALRSELLDPWRAGPGAAYRLGVHDLSSDAVLDLPWRRVPEDALLLTDGIFTQRDELRGYWDLAIFLDVRFTVSVRRMAARDGSADDPRHPELRRYLDGQRIYLTRCDPRGRADIVVENDDLARPRIVRWPSAPPFGFNEST